MCQHKNPIRRIRQTPRWLSFQATGLGKIAGPPLKILINLEADHVHNHALFCVLRRVFAGITAGLATVGHNYDISAAAITQNIYRSINGLAHRSIAFRFHARNLRQDVQICVNLRHQTNIDIFTRAQRTRPINHQPNTAIGHNAGQGLRQRVSCIINAARKRRLRRKGRHRS